MNTAKIIEATTRFRAGVVDGATRVYQRAMQSKLLRSPNVDFLEKNRMTVDRVHGLEHLEKYLKGLKTKDGRAKFSQEGINEAMTAGLQIPEQFKLYAQLANFELTPFEIKLITHDTKDAKLIKARYTLASTLSKVLEPKQHIGMGETILSAQTPQQAKIKGNIAKFLSGCIYALPFCGRHTHEFGNVQITHLTSLVSTPGQSRLVKRMANDGHSMTDIMNVIMFADTPQKAKRANKMLSKGIEPLHIGEELMSMKDEPSTQRGGFFSRLRNSFGK